MDCIDCFYKINLKDVQTKNAKSGKHIKSF